jgi:hypothetical protein
MKQLIEDLISALEYHVEQTRPIYSTTVALQAAREALKSFPPQRTWTGLTDEEYLEAESVVWITINLDSDEKEANRDFYQAIEAKLKEKNFKE